MTQQNKEVRTRGRPSWALDSESEDEDGDSTIGCIAITFGDSVREAEWVCSDIC